MADSFDILLKFQMDQAANDRVARGISTIEQELKKIRDAFPGEELGKETEKFREELDKTGKKAKETAAILRAEARVMVKEADAIVDDFRIAQLNTAKNLASQFEGIARTGLVAGVALIGGIVAAANDYAKNAEVATRSTLAWQAAQDSLNRSQQRFGAVALEAALPLLQRTAQLAERASRFAERHPDVVRAALNTGVALATLSAVGIAVTRGIKFVADLKLLAMIPIQLRAAELQERAADKQLLAAQIRAKELGASTGGGSTGGGVLGGLTSPTGSGLIIASTLAASVAAGKALKNLEERLVSFAAATGRGVAILKPVFTLIDTSLTTLNPLIPATRNLAASLERDIPAIARLLGLIGDSAQEAARGSKGGRTPDLASETARVSTETFQQALRAYEDYRRDDLALVQKHYQDRQNIIAGALAAEQSANAQFAANVAKLRQQTAGALADAARDFAEANRRAEEQYARDRAAIIKDGGEEIERIEADLQEQLRKNALEHAERAADLTASRDALGLAKETRRFQEQQDEARREADREIAERRQDIAQRLADLKASFEQERAERAADYQARVAEIKANAAERMRELQAQHQQELREIQIQKINRLRELDAQFTEERRRRYDQFVQQLRDLDANLLGEKRLREQYQAAMLRDLNTFLTTYKNRLATLGEGIPARAMGGYASGLVRTGERGYEYVLSHSTTRAAEAMIGGRLTQQSLLAALMRGGGRGSSVTWNDRRSFSGEYTKELRRAIRQDTVALLEEILQ